MKIYFKYKMMKNILFLHILQQFWSHVYESHFFLKWLYLKNLFVF